MKAMFKSLIPLLACGAVLGAALPSLAIAEDAAQSAAPQSVALRPELVVEGAYIRLGDLFAVEGEAAATVLARAPEPGQRAALNVDFVRRKAAEAGYDWANASDLLRVTVARASRRLDASDLGDILAGELFARTGSHHEVRLSNTGQAIHAPIDSIGAFEIVELNHDERTGMFAALISAYDGHDGVRVTGRAHPTIEAPVLVRPIRAGEIISEDDVSWASFRTDRLRADAVAAPEDLIGMTPRRALRANEPVRGFDLQRPTAVARGETVTLVFSSGALQLSVQARALENAAEGETVRFVNLHSNRTVEARVERAGLARVAGGLGPAF